MNVTVKPLNNVEIAFFQKFVDAFEGKSYAPYLSDDQFDFLKSCPINKKGWHYAQIRKFGTIHMKYGVNFRNAKPYRLVKINGLLIYSSLSGYETIRPHIWVDGNSVMSNYWTFRFKRLPKPKEDEVNFLKEVGICETQEQAFLLAACSEYNFLGEKKDRWERWEYSREEVIYDLKNYFRDWLPAAKALCDKPATALKVRLRLFDNFS